MSSRPRRTVRSTYARGGRRVRIQEPPVQQEQDPAMAAVQPAAQPAAVQQAVADDLSDVEREMRDYLISTIGLSEEQAKAVRQQGIESHESLLEFTDQDIKDLCERVKSPGGLIENPLSTEQNRGTVPQFIPNRGTSLPLAKEKLLRQLAFYRRHLRRVQRAWIPSEATLERVKHLWESRFEKEEDGRKNPPEPPKPLVKISEFRKTYEDLQAYLNNTIGCNGSPLAYVVCNETIPAVGGIDPGYGQPSYHEELVRRTPLDGPHFQADNESVWKVLRQVFHGTPAWPWISLYEKPQNGRGASIALSSHYMGNAYVKVTASQADAVLARLRFDGKGRNLTWENFTSHMIQCYADLEEQNEPVAEAKKVRTLIDAIEDPRMEAGKSHALGDETKSKNFIAALNYLVEIHAQVNRHNIQSSGTRTLASLETLDAGRGRGDPGRGGRGRGRGRGRGGRGHAGRGYQGRGNQGRSAFDSADPSKYYEPEEWATLSYAEKGKVYAAREKRLAEDQGEESKEEPPRKVKALDTRTDEQQQESQQHDNLGGQMSRRPRR